MRMFVIPAGTKVGAIEVGQPLESVRQVRVVNTALDNNFEREDIVLDPVGRLTSLGGQFADKLKSLGYYGFTFGRWVMLVHMSHVTVI